MVRTEHWKECETLSLSTVTVAVDCTSTGASTIYTINDPCPCEHLDTPRSLSAYKVQAADLTIIRYTLTTDRDAWTGAHPSKGHFPTHT